MTYYLRFEAVNMGNFIYDTNDLSTIRGGGLSLLNAPDKVESFLKTMLPKKYKSVSKGASSALFELDINEDKALTIKQDIFAKLKAETIDNEPNPLRHATFVIDILPQGKKFKEDRDSLLALNRWQQMQAPSLSIPKPAQKVCAQDKMRPGSEEDYAPSGEKIYLSASVKSRRDYGKEQKRGEFYESRTSCLRLKFTNDLQDLSNYPKKDILNGKEAVIPKQGILDGKIAVIYLDGNKFGKVVGVLKDIKQHRKFDEKLREAQDNILKDLIKIASTNESGLWKLGDKIRLETLLWGGDELCWVVPACLGWWTLNFFYAKANEHMRSELLMPNNYPSENKKLSFASGLVYCHHNAPIHRITALAKNIAQIPKDLAAYQYKNTVAYQILESFDHAGLDIESYRKNRLANLGQPEHLLVAAKDMAELEKNITELKKNNFPKRKSYQIIQAHLAGKTEQAGNLQQKVLEDVGPLEKANIEIALKKLKELCGNENAHWLHLTDLWDYLTVEADNHV